MRCAAWARTSFFAPRFLGASTGASTTSPVSSSTSSATGRVDLLHVRPVAAVLDDDELAVDGVLAEHAVARDGRVDELLRLRRA